MKSKHKAFYKKYYALKNQEAQFEFMKQYMLSMSADEVFEFVMDGIHDFGKFITENKFTPEQVEFLDEELGECIAKLQKTKARRPMEVA